MLSLEHFCSIPLSAEFQKVPAPNVTATKLMVNFLHLSPNISSLVKRQAPYIEDIVLVLDGSGSVGKCEFNKGKKALHYMAGLAAESQYDTKYAAVTFATSAVINFNFTHYDIAANKTLQISYPGGLTNTQAGLLLARNLFVNPSGTYSGVNGIRKYFAKLAKLDNTYQN